jgi:release factor glutamine methyltransferase
MAEPVELGETMRRAKRRLEEAGIDSAEIDARLIVEHMTRTTRLDLIARPDQLVAGPHVEAIDAALARRAAREPVHRILGAREFYGLPMRISAETLEPRPDTEILVDAVLAVAAKGSLRILDLGTGTGAILIALLAERPQAAGVAVDISGDALETARANADLNGVATRFSALKSDWFANVTGEFDVIVSNPPYIATRKMADLDLDVRGFDPQRALDGGPDGLDCYRAIAAGAGRHLRSEGSVGVEIGHDQKDAVTAIFEDAGFTRHAIRKDLGGNDRALIFRQRD